LPLLLRTGLRKKNWAGCWFLVKTWISSDEEIIVLLFRQRTGWPDWAIFCLLGNCLLWVVFVNNCANFFSDKSYALIFRTKLNGPHFGRRFFYKRILSPCSTLALFGPLLRVEKSTYLHTYLPTYIHTYIHTYVHAYYSFWLHLFRSTTSNTYRSQSYDF
jgi:hypothetical protein